MALEISLNGKVALITGVSAGLGAAISAMFAKAGASISGCDIQEEEGGRLAGAGAKTLYTKCDVTKQEDLQNLVRRTVDVFGRIDIVVSNAGRNFFAGSAACSDEEWRQNMELNLASHWRLAKLCKPYLDQAAPGVIIVMASNHAYSTIPGCFPYNVAKTALTGLVRSLAIEWGPAIRTIGLAPGFIDTPGNQKWFDSFPDADAERKRTIDGHPVKRIGTPDEVGAWCVFLASEFAAFASGTTYLLDGGRSAMMQDS